jgi:hypothetical protein
MAPYSQAEYQAKNILKQATGYYWVSTPSRPLESSHGLLICLGSNQATCAGAPDEVGMVDPFTWRHIWPFAERCLLPVQSANVLNIYLANLASIGNTLGWSTYPWNWNNPTW